MRHSLLVSLVTAGLLSWSQVGRAQGDDKQRAKDAYAEGTNLARGQKWAEAAAKFALADALAPNETALDAAVEASLRADDAVLGMNLVERAERSQSTRALPSVGTARDRFGARVALLEIPCVALATPCRSALDGAAINAARTWVAPGSHKVVFETETGPRDVPFEISAGSTRLVTPPPAPEPVKNPAEEKAKALPPAPPPEVSSGGVSGFWILLPASVTVAAGAVTAGFGAAFLSSESDFTEAQGVQPAAAQQALIDETEAWQDRTNVMVAVVAVSAAATAAVVVAVLATQEDGDEPSVGFVVAPSVGGGATFAVHGRF